MFVTDARLPVPAAKAASTAAVTTPAEATADAAGVAAPAGGTGAGTATKPAQQAATEWSGAVPTTEDAQRAAATKQPVTRRRWVRLHNRKQASP